MIRPTGGGKSGHGKGQGFFYLMFILQQKYKYEIEQLVPFTFP
jgi:hypothetical protein